MKNEKEVFTKKAVRDLLLKHELVQLNTNHLENEKQTPEAEKNAELMNGRLRWTVNPLYVILEPTKDGFTEVARTEGRLDQFQFAEFLSKPKTSDRIKFEVEVTPKSVRPGEVVTLTIKGTPGASYHTYPLTVRAPKQDLAQLSKLEIIETSDLKPLWPVKESEPEFVKEGKDILLELKRPFTWTQDILIQDSASPGETVVPFFIRLQVCDTRCVWGTHYYSVPLTIKNEKAVSPSIELKGRSDEKKPEIKVRELPDDLKTLADGSKPGGEGLLGFILQGVFWGAISLLTPCVFPMIPITVSFFLKQSERENHKPLLMASVYCGTIVVVLTIAAVALLSFFRAVSTHWAMNFGLGALFIFFALSLFGMYEIELPSGLARFTSSREGSSLIGTMFMALTFTIISFACVAPFLGGFGGTAASSNLGFTKILLGGLAFSITFASPFMILALFPALLKKMPKSGTWLNSVKVVMGFLELAAALKFFRQGELLVTSETHLFTYDFVLGLYVAISILCGLYLLGVYRLPHDTPQEHVGVMRMLMGLAFFGLGFYLLPAMFKVDSKGTSQRPRGVVFAWLDSFLLPEDEADLPWIGDLDEAIKIAEKTPGKRIFIDFTGKTCTNCKINEKEVFTKREVRELLEQFVLVQLFTDVVPNRLYPAAKRRELKGVSQQHEDAKKNLAFQKDAFDTEQLPLYAIVEPDGKGGWRKIAVYDEGKINDIEEFVGFLSSNVGSAEK
jgi:thiol:disulfide interchange protein DsbD